MSFLLPAAGIHVFLKKYYKQSRKITNRFVQMQNVSFNIGIFFFG